MTRFGPLVCSLCCLALAGCDSGFSLKEFPGKSLLLVATDPGAPAFDLELRYDTSTGCGRIGGVRVTQDGRDLKASERGGLPPDAGDLPCPFARWPMLAGAADAQFTTLKLEDGSGMVQATLRYLFAPRTVSLKTGPSARVGDWVEFEYQPPSDTVGELEVSFLASGAEEVDRVSWYRPDLGQATFEKNFVTVAVPTRQSPASGTVRFAGVSRPDLYACDGLEGCKVEGLSLGFELAFTVTP